MLTELLEKMPFQFQFMSINDDIELTPTAIANNHDSKRAIDALGRDLTRGELASTFNHMLCYEKFLDSENDIAIILEDDADFIVDEFNRVINLITKIIDENKPQVYLLTPVISYLNKNLINLSADYKVVQVVQSWDSSGYIINRKTAKKLIDTNSKAWFIADDWVRYNRYAKINVFSILPTIIKQNLNLFDSHLISDRSKAIKNRSIKYVLSRIGFKIISNFKNTANKICWFCINREFMYYNIYLGIKFL